jgi:acyl-CoA synthetase (AMP-forming)/AMP-acid ligase II
LSVTSGICWLPDIVRVWSGKTPNKAALIDGGRVVTYAQLNDRSNRIANRLIAAGIRPLSHIGFLGKNSAAFFEIWVGASKAGCALAPLNANGRDVPSGDAGEVLVRSPGMFSGCWNKPDATAAAIRGGWYHTGDAGIRDEEGNLFLVDRLKDMIVSGGENIYSAEVERALMSHASVESAAVVGAPDEKWGQRVVAFVVTNPDKPVEVFDLVSHCRGLIAGYKVPKEIHPMDTLPHTASGKVQKAALRQQLQG